MEHASGAPGALEHQHPSGGGEPDSRAKYIDDEHHGKPHSGRQRFGGAVATDMGRGAAMTCSACGCGELFRSRRPTEWIRQPTNRVVLQSRPTTLSAVIDGSPTTDLPMVQRRGGDRFDAEPDGDERESGHRANGGSGRGRLLRDRDEPGGLQFKPGRRRLATPRTRSHPGRCVPSAARHSPRLQSSTMKGWTR